MDPSPTLTALVLATGVGVGVFFTSFVPRVLSPSQSTLAPEPATWGLREVGGVLLGGLLAVQVLGALVRSVGSASFLVQLVASQGALVLTAGLGWFLVARAGDLAGRAGRTPSTHAHLGLVLRPGDGSWTWRSLAAYGLTYPALLAVQLAWNLLAPRLGLELEPQEVLVEMLGLRRELFALAVLVAVLVGPLVEEVLFRGFVQPGLVRATGSPARGIAVTSVLFAALHGLSAFPQIFLLSLLLGWIRERTGSTLLAGLVHALHNGQALLLALLLPQLADLPPTP